MQRYGANHVTIALGWMDLKHFYCPQHVTWEGSVIGKYLLWNNYSPGGHFSLRYFLLTGCVASMASKNVMHYDLTALEFIFLSELWLIRSLITYYFLKNDTRWQKLKCPQIFLFKSFYQTTTPTELCASCKENIQFFFIIAQIVMVPNKSSSIQEC